MHKLKSDIIHALQGVPVSTDKLVEIADICDAYIKAEAHPQADNTAQVAIALMKQLNNADILNCDDKEAYNVLEDILSEWNATVNHA